MKPFVVYTAMIGGYDEVRQPLCVDDRFDYILFTDEVKQPQIGVWQVRKVEYINPDKVRIARYVKTHPDSLLSGYKATLWIDSNIQIATNYLYKKVQSMYNMGLELASVKHPVRDCIFDESYYVMSHCLYVHEKDIFRWCRYLKKESFPRHYGMYETNILYRKTCELNSKINSLWWECIEAYAKRDQLSQMFAIWHYSDVKRTDILSGEDARTSKDVNCFKHLDRSKRKIVYKNYAEIRRARYRDLKWCLDFNLRFYYSLYSIPFYPIILLKLWEIVIGSLYQFYKIKDWHNKQ